LVKTHDRLVIEDLNASGMLSNHRTVRCVPQRVSRQLARRWAPRDEFVVETGEDSPGTVASCSSTYRRCRRHWGDAQDAHVAQVAAYGIGKVADLSSCFHNECAEPCIGPQGKCCQDPFDAPSRSRYALATGGHPRVPTWRWPAAALLWSSFDSHRVIHTVPADSPPAWPPAAGGLRMQRSDRSPTALPMGLRCARPRIRPRRYVLRAARTGAGCGRGVGGRSARQWRRNRRRPRDCPAAPRRRPSPTLGGPIRRRTAPAVARQVRLVRRRNRSTQPNH